TWPPWRMARRATRAGRLAKRQDSIGRGWSAAREAGEPPKATCT
ncbi:jg4518, partial [Pararge aegeria aegeria]